MLNLSADAASEIRRLADGSERPDTAGLRISNDSPGSVRVSLAVLPAADDAVINESGARIFLDQRAASILDDKTLATITDKDGRVHFAIAEQSA
jgi:Fe-S cluster assembly iron-binding protein IscA